MPDSILSECFQKAEEENFPNFEIKFVFLKTFHVKACSCTISAAWFKYSTLKFVCKKTAQNHETIECDVILLMKSIMECHRQAADFSIVSLCIGALRN